VFGAAEPRLARPATVHLERLRGRVDRARIRTDVERLDEPRGRLFAPEAMARAGDAVMLARDPVDLPLLGPLLGRAAPFVHDFARSDHKPFWDLGMPAIQVTDTANFRNPHYHQPTDTPETLDYERIADIVAATAAIVTAGSLY